ncbi:N-alpha-acetyltransferase 60 [Entamoeba marina]
MSTPITSPPTIRRGQYNDLNRIWELHDSLFHILSNHSCVVLVAEIKGIVVGFASFKEEWEVRDNGYVKFAGLLTFGVDEKYQKCGIGGSLLEDGCKVMRNKSCSYIYLHALLSNKDVHKFYENHQFQRIRVIKQYYSFDQTPQDAVLFQRHFEVVYISVFTYLLDCIYDCFDWVMS